MLHRAGFSRAALGGLRAAGPTPSLSAIGLRPRLMPVTSGSYNTAARESIGYARSYAGMPSQNHLSDIFSTPFRQFIMTLSRIARIVVYTATGVALIAVVSFEGTHLYVEHVAMPKGQAGWGVFDGNDEKEDVKASAKVFSSTSEQDLWGWTHDFGEETWVGLNKRGTDPRLGFVGRHQLRAAWMSLNWGAGYEPRHLVNSGGGIGSPAGGVGKGSGEKLYVQDGSSFCESYLLSILMAAEKNGIRVPDMAAVRAGLQTYAGATPNDRRPNQTAIDRTAVMLEYLLASTRERIGTPNALRGALAAYTRLYDALSSVAATNRAMKAEGKFSGQPLVATDRLVRLATRTGELHALLGNRKEAEQWLQSAVSVAGGETVPAIVGASSAEADQRAQPTEPSALVTAAPGAVAAPADPAPASPSLTRSLIQSLLALSAFYAEPLDRSSLERALQFQANALRITRAETGRMNAPDAKQPSQLDDPLGAQLHRLWLAHHDGLACVHVGETMYGLQRSSSKGGLSSLLSAVGLAGNSQQQEKQRKQGQTIAWLDEARSRSDLVLSQLTNAKALRPRETGSLLPKWKEAPIAVQTYAERLLRDATRLRDTVDDMKRILQTDNVTGKK